MKTNMTKHPWFAAGLVLALVGCGKGYARPSAEDGAPAVAALTASRYLGRTASARAEAPSRLLSVELPASGRAPARLRLQGLRATVDMEPLELTRAAAPAQLLGGLHVFANLAPDADRVVTEGSESFEELWVLRSPRAPTAFRLRVEVEGAHRVELRDGRVEILDEAGVLQLSTEPIVAEDARGVRRKLSLSPAPQSSPRSLELIARLDASGLVFPIVVDPAWNSTASLAEGRAAGIAITLASGRVLVAGGGPNGAELYDPVLRKWTAAGTQTAGSSIGYQADYPNPGTRLTSGQVLIVDPYAGAADRYDPASNAWTATAPAPTSGFRGVAAFPAGATYGAGAVAACNNTTAANVYSTASNGWAATTAMNNIHNRCTAVALASGRVLVVGGGTAIAEVYNPATKAWTNTGAMSGARDFPAVVLLPSGKVLAAGGSVAGATTSTAELYDPATNLWTATPAMSAVHGSTQGVLTSAGKVLIPGGSGPSRAVDQYDPATNTWTKLPDMISIRKYPMVAPLANGQVLVAGGWQNDSSSTTALVVGSVEIYGKSLGNTCAAATDCASGFCVDGVCCSTSSCAAGTYCNLPAKLGTCSKQTGSLCAGAAECANGLCVDGVCCESACAGQCQACDVPGYMGKCFPVVGAPHGKRLACSGAGVGTACGPSCDGTNTAACVLPGATTSCGKASCAAGIETQVGKCSGTGTCSTTPKGCGAYACGATTCNVSCATAIDCAAGYTCKAGVCKPADGLGGACASAADCTSGFCTDGVCCGVALCGVGSSCATAERAGSCAKVQGTACGSDPECASGHCVDGVCCQTACDGQCEACDVAGSFGACTPVLGAPHGARAACADGAGDACAAKACDGTSTTSCAAFVNGASTTCAPSKCELDTFTGPSACDLAGACKAPEAQRCVPYKCDDAGCRTGCTSDEHCVGGYVCKEQQCQAIVATCSADGSQSTAKDGLVTPCSPYLCTSIGTCGTACASSVDCASGFICNTESKVCVAAPAASSGDSGGCSAPSGQRPAGGAVLGLLSLMVVARRRRRG